MLRLIDAIPGKRIRIPKKDVLLNGPRKRAIIHDYNNGGYTMEALAKKYGVTTSTVFNYIHK